jgi:uncharacterized protein YndB with AHSA1/START domain
MSERSVRHSSFVVERRYDASPERVFAAWAEPDAKRRWFSGPEERSAFEHELDFRPGGREINRVGPPEGPLHTFDARYHDIVPARRIIYSYDIYLDERRVSVALATVELVADGPGTRLIFTEQDAILDDGELTRDRARGTRDLLDALAAELERVASTG